VIEKKKEKKIKIFGEIIKRRYISFPNILWLMIITTSVSLTTLVILITLTILVTLITLITIAT
jgi:hypothetical protein